VTDTLRVADPYSNPRKSPLSSSIGRRYAATAAIFIVLVAMGAAAYWFLTSGPGNRIISAPGSQLSEFNGSGDQTTTSFAVRGQWQIHWENTGKRFRFAVEGDRDLGTIIDQDGPGSGVTSVVANGEFHLVITAEGNWRVRITQGE
jgi:hypothetical protein